MKKCLVILIVIFIISSIISAQTQTYYKADPFYLFEYEKSLFEKSKKSNSFLFRPFFNFKNANEQRWKISIRGEFFNSNNIPNLENTSVRWVGRGKSNYSSINISYVGKHLALSIEPYHFMSENLEFDVPERRDLHKRLNDNRPHIKTPFLSTSVRELQLFLHHNEFGFGISNANMWWGPGIHSSLQMSTNTVGFRYFLFGTLKEKRINNFGFDLKYLFTHLDEKNMGEPYFTAILFSSTLYSNPEFTLGISRSYLSGPGTLPPMGRNLISMEEALLLPFEGLFLEGKQTDLSDPESSVDLWDQIMVGYFVASFPSSGLKIYIEYGRDDHAWDWDDFSRQPDHSGANIIGIRKYGLFGNKNLVGGIEYINLIKSKFWTKRIPGTWYNKEFYDHNSYDGRHWGAHSGPDSDDFYIYLGYMGEKFSIIPAFNYERHGVIDNRAVILEKRPYLVYNPDTGRWEAQIVEQWRERQVNIWPEVKIEFRLDIRYRFKGFDFNFYYEDEFVDNLEFNWGERRGKVWWIGIERTIDNEDFQAFRKRKLP